MHIDDLPSEVVCLLLLPVLSIHDLVQLSRVSKRWNWLVSYTLCKSHPITRLIFGVEFHGQRFPIDKLSAWKGFVQDDRSWFAWLGSWGGSVSIEGWKELWHPNQVHYLVKSHICSELGQDQDAVTPTPSRRRSRYLTRDFEIPGDVESLEPGTSCRTLSPPPFIDSCDDRTIPRTRRTRSIIYYPRRRSISPNQSTSHCLACTFLNSPALCSHISWCSENETDDTLQVISRWKEVIDFTQKVVIALCKWFEDESNVEVRLDQEVHEDLFATQLGNDSKNTDNLSSTYYRIQLAFMIESMLAYQLDLISTRLKSVNLRNYILMDSTLGRALHHSRSVYGEIRKWCNASIEEVNILYDVACWTLDGLLTLGIELASTICLRNGLLDIYLKWLFHPENKPSYVQWYLFRFVEALKAFDRSASSSTPTFTLTSHLKLHSHLLQYIMEMHHRDSRQFYVNCMLLMFESFPHFIDNDSLQHVMLHIVRHLNWELLPYEIRIKLANQCKRVLMLVQNYIQGEPSTSTASTKINVAKSSSIIMLPPLDLPSPLLAIDVTAINGESNPISTEPLYPPQLCPWTRKQFTDILHATYDEYLTIRASLSCTSSMSNSGVFSEDSDRRTEKLANIDEFMKMIWGKNWPPM